MDIAAIDYWSYSGRSRLHRASAASKLIMVGILVAAVILARQPVTLAIFYALLVSVLWTTRLPMTKMLLLSAYPVLFSLLFIFSRWDGEWAPPLVILLKTMGAALSVLILIGTTPYPEIFGCLQRVLPPIVTDGLYMTYRSLFILLKELDRLVTAFRLRGGWSKGPLRRRIDNLAAALGLLLVHALNQSQRQVAVMVVRGYQGKLAEPRPAFVSWPLDLWPVVLGGAGLAVVLVRGG